MATLRLDATGRSTNAALSNSGNIAAGDTEYSVLVNMSSSAVKVQFDTSTDVEILRVYNSLNDSGGAKEVSLDGPLGKQYLIVQSGEGVTLRGNNSGSGTHGFNLGIHGVTALHRTNAHENQDIMWTRNDVSIAS